MEMPSVETLLNLGSAVTVVLMFLRYLQSRDSAQQSLENQRHEVLKSMASECHVHSGKITSAFVDAVKESRDAIKENTHALGRIHDRWQTQRQSPSASKNGSESGE